MSNYKTEVFVVKWVSILYVLSIVAFLLFFKVHFLKIGLSLTIITVLCLIKFWLNSTNIYNQINRNKLNGFIIIAYNLLFFLALFLGVYLIYKTFGYIDLYISIGLMLGVSYIPLVIVVGGILQSKYFIRNKF